MKVVCSSYRNYTKKPCWKPVSLLYPKLDKQQWVLWWLDTDNIIFCLCRPASSSTLLDHDTRQWPKFLRIVFGQPFVKWFALCCRSVVLSVCLSLSLCPVLSVMLVYCGQTVGWIKIKLGTQVIFGPGHMVLYGNPAPPPPKGHSPQFSAHICCGQIAG